MIGFKIDEIMVGTHQFVAGDTREHPLTFTLTWGHPCLLKFLNPFADEFLCGPARGFITVGGLVNKADCAGTIQLLYFSARKIRYELDFLDEAGHAYRYVGEKTNLWPWNLHKTHVTCHGTITAAGKEVSRSVVSFPYREIVPFVLSARIIRTEAHTPPPP